MTFGSVLRILVKGNDPKTVREAAEIVTEAAKKGTKVLKQVPEIIQPKRTQAYYDDLADIWNKGASYVNERTGHVIHTYAPCKNSYSVNIYKLQTGKSLDEIVKNEKCLYRLEEDSYYGLQEFDRYIKHGDQGTRYLSTWNAQRRAWTGKYWVNVDNNHYLRFQTYWRDNSHSLFGKCVDS